MAYFQTLILIRALAFIYVLLADNNISPIMLADSMLHGQIRPKRPTNKRDLFSPYRPAENFSQMILGSNRLSPQQDQNYEQVLTFRKKHHQDKAEVPREKKYIEIGMKEFNDYHFRMEETAKNYLIQESEDHHSQDYHLPYSQASKHNTINLPKADLTAFGSDHTIIAHIQSFTHEVKPAVDKPKIFPQRAEKRNSQSQLKIEEQFWSKKRNNKGLPYKTSTYIPTLTLKQSSKMRVLVYHTPERDGNREGRDGDKYILKLRNVYSSLSEQQQRRRKSEERDRECRIRRKQYNLSRKLLKYRSQSQHFLNDYQNSQIMKDMEQLTPLRSQMILHTKKAAQASHPSHEKITLDDQRIHQQLVEMNRKSSPGRQTPYTISLEKQLVRVKTEKSRSKSQTVQVKQKQQKLVGVFRKLNSSKHEGIGQIVQPLKPNWHYLSSDKQRKERREGRQKRSKQTIKINQDTSKASKNNLINCVKLICLSKPENNFQIPQLLSQEQPKLSLPLQFSGDRLLNRSDRGRKSPT